jgi:transcriptional regulator with XRE-family HTH domain
MMTVVWPDFSGMVKSTREALGMTQPQFAQLLGVTPAAVFLWERGDRQPEGAALRLLYALSEQLKHRKPRASDVENVLKALAVGAAAVGFLALLAALFSSKE